MKEDRNWDSFEHAAPFQHDWLGAAGRHRTGAKATGDGKVITDHAGAIHRLVGTLSTPPNQIVSSRNVFALYNAHYSGAFAMTQIGERLDDSKLIDRGKAEMEQARQAVLGGIDASYTHQSLHKFFRR